MKRALDETGNEVIGWLHQLFKGGYVMSVDVMLFPPFLEEGAQGPGVAVLQLLLKALRFDPDNTIMVDGDFGENTAEAVRRLQEQLFFTGKDVDGKFGPATRRKFQDIYRIDVNSIPLEPFIRIMEAAR